jgi:serine/threonine protein kinase
MSKSPHRKYELIAKGWCANIYRVLDTDMVCRSSASSCVDAFQAEKIAYDRFEEAYELPSLWNAEPNDEDVTQDDLSILTKPRQGCLRVSKNWKINIPAYYGADSTAPNTDPDAPLRPPKADRDASTCPPYGILLSYMPQNCLGHFLWVARHFNHNNPLLQPTSQLFLRGTCQATEGLAYALACSVLHSDIFHSNFLLDANLNIKIGDWGGACTLYNDGDNENWSTC